MEARQRCRIMGMADRVNSDDSGRKSWWRRCGTTDMDTAAEEMRDCNRRDVGRRRWRNGLEGRRLTGKISTGENYQPKGVSSLRQIRRGGNNGPAR